MSDVNVNSSEMRSGAGALLRQARESQGVAVDTLAGIIKVPAMKLSALEAEDWALLPDPNLNRALAMTICRALKVDSAPIMAQMPAAVATSLAASKEPLNQPFRDFAHTGLTFERSSPLSLRVPKMTSAVLGPLVLLLLAAGVYFAPDQLDWEAWFPAFTSKEAPQPASVASGVEMGAPVSVMDVASSASVAAPAVVSVAASSASAVTVSAVASQASAPLTSVSTAPSAAVVASTPSAPVALQKPTVQASVVASVPSAASVPTIPVAKMTLSSKDAAWVEVRDSTGQKLFSRQLAAGERVDLQGRPPLNVVAGNAPSVSIQFNGRSVDLAPIIRQNVARIELK